MAVPKRYRKRSSAEITPIGSICEAASDWSIFFLPEVLLSWSTTVTDIKYVTLGLEHCHKFCINVVHEDTCRRNEVSC